MRENHKREKRESSWRDHMKVGLHMVQHMLTPTTDVEGVTICSITCSRTTIKWSPTSRLFFFTFVILPDHTSYNDFHQYRWNGPKGFEHVAAVSACPVVPAFIYLTTFLNGDRSVKYTLYWSRAGGNVVCTWMSRKLLGLWSLEDSDYECEHKTNDGSTVCSRSRTVPVGPVSRTPGTCT